MVQRYSATKGFSRLGLGLGLEDMLFFYVLMRFNTNRKIKLMTDLISLATIAKFERERGTEKLT